MKKFLLSLLSAVLFLNVKADEGMWIPLLIGKNIAEMQKMGFKLTAEDIYSINKSSLKDAIVHFGGGCTGEMISGSGLLITNHHCGYENIADASSVEHNYLRDGFWAKSLQQEIPAKGLSVKFLVYMQDVTQYVTPSKTRFPKKEDWDKEQERVMNNIKKDATDGGRYVTEISSYYNNNQYFLLVYEVFKDVRLVGTPPESLGKFGGDTDNWMWPRHTADFSMFRVYAGRDNRPADYSPDNVPYKPKKFLPVSIAGVKTDDFAMIMGYPGRTNRYATSYELDMSINETNPSIVKVRNEKLGIMRKYMAEDEAVNLKLASSYARIANYWKYYIGQTEQLKRLNVVQQKQNEERTYLNWATNNNRNGNLMNEFSNAVSLYRPYAKSVVYYSEAFYGSAVARMAANTSKLYEELSKPNPNQEEIKKLATAAKTLRTTLMESYVPAVEQEMLAKTASMMYQDLPKAQLPTFYDEVLFPRYGGNIDVASSRFAEDVFKNSLFVNDAKFNNFINNPTKKALQDDLLAQYAYAFVDNYNKNLLPRATAYSTKKSELAQAYQEGMLAKNNTKSMYPDANSTMRLSYGTVGGYNPEDAVYYDYKTTIDGLLAKYIPGDHEFDLQQDFIALAKSRKFGRYADNNGDLIVNFLTNNDITGGNSGSPVMNDKGELIGLAFDGNWEAMSGDIAYDKKFKKTIVVDSRFVLWLIEHYGKADNLIREMDIREN